VAVELRGKGAPHNRADAAVFFAGEVDELAALLLVDERADVNTLRPLALANCDIRNSPRSLELSQG
jgi:hypothetical protein